MQKLSLLAAAMSLTLALSACTNSVEQTTTADQDATAAAAPAGVQIPKGVKPPIFDDTRLVPTKVFDNLYCIGSRSVVCYALTTSEGIILIDSMWDNKDAKFIEQSLIDLKLDPQDIKYIFVTHGHGDHYGGTSYLANKYKAKVVMSAVDTKFMQDLTTGPNGPRSPKPQVDIFADHNYKLTLGDTTVTLLSTPGHTPGCMSAMFNVYDKGTPHTAVLWGGTGLPKNDEQLLQAYVKSAEDFYTTTTTAAATVALCAHLFRYDGYATMDFINKNPQGPNPLVKTPEQMVAYLNELIDTAKAKQNEGK